MSAIDDRFGALSLDSIPVGVLHLRCGPSSFRPGLHLFDPTSSLGTGDDIDLDEPINDLSLATGQEFEQRKLFASFDQPSSRCLHVTVDRVDLVLLLRIPRQREDVLHMVSNTFYLRECLDEVRLGMHRIQEDGGKNERTFGRQRIGCEMDSGIFEFWRLVRGSRSNATSTYGGRQQKLLFGNPGLLLLLDPCSFLKDTPSVEDLIE